MDLLSHRAERDSAQRLHDRRAAAIAEATGPGQDDLVALVSKTLFHQGTPIENARRVAESLDEGRSCAWDEAGYEVVDARVEVWFLRDAMDVDRSELRALVARIIERLEAAESE